jgi:hypothetical protein
MSTSKTQLLDPIGTLCRLTSLNFRPVGTKIGINNHVAIIQLPGGTQWLERYINGDDRDNISELFYSITRVVEWYIIPFYSMKNVKLESSRTFDSNEPSKKEVDAFWKYLDKLCNNVCLALKKMQQTYSNGNVVLALQYYILLLEDAQNGTYNIKRLPSCYVDKEQKNFLDYDKIKGLWNCKKLKEICDLYDKCFDASNSNDSMKVDGYLLAIDKLLEQSDNEFKNLIKGNNMG